MRPATPQAERKKPCASQRQLMSRRKPCGHGLQEGSRDRKACPIGDLYEGIDRDAATEAKSPIVARSDASSAISARTYVTLERSSARASGETRLSLAKCPAWCMRKANKRQEVPYALVGFRRCGFLACGPPRGAADEHQRIGSAEDRPSVGRAYQELERLSGRLFLQALESSAWP